MVIKKHTETDRGKEGERQNLILEIIGPLWHRAACHYLSIKEPPPPGIHPSPRPLLPITIPPPCHRTLERQKEQGAGLGAH